MVATSLLARHLDNILGESNFAGNLHRKRATWLTLLQLKERADVLHIEHHRTIGNTLGARCIIFNIRVVSCNHAIAPLLKQTLQNSLGYGTTDYRLCTRTKLINQNKSTRRCRLQHTLHIHQVRRIGRKVVIHRLLIANINADTLKHRQFAHLTCSNREAALEHILHYTCGFQADRLTTCIRTRDNQYMFLSIKLHIKWHQLLLLSLESLRQQWMERISQHHSIILRDNGFACSVLHCPAGFGTHSIHLGEVLSRNRDWLCIGA